VHRRYAGRGLAVVGVHTPEFERERNAEAVRDHVRREGLDYPHLLDNDYGYWKRLGNEYWPTAYLVDRCGRIRARHVGEIHEDEETGRAMEAELGRLLKEPAEACGGR
jgi:hypothetical protein